MAHLVIGKDVIEIRSAIKAIKSNIKMLKARMESVPTDTATGQKMKLFYANEMGKHVITLMWLNKHKKITRSHSTDR